MENSIKMDLQEIFCDGVDWIDVAENRDRLRAFFEHDKEMLGFIKCEELRH
jgi:hypothetical protein